jgi:cold shock CspA family protein
VGGPVPSAGPHHGRVTSFDPTRGLGTVADDAGSDLDFHATAIADGSRRIEVGTEVSFSVGPGHRGRYEARSLVPAVPAASSPFHQRPR